MDFPTAQVMRRAAPLLLAALALGAFLDKNAVPTLPGAVTDFGNVVASARSKNHTSTAASTAPAAADAGVDDGDNNDGRLSTPGGIDDGANPSDGVRRKLKVFLLAGRKFMWRNARVESE